MDLNGLCPCPGRPEWRIVMIDCVRAAAIVALLACMVRAADDDVRPFRIQVQDAVLEDLNQRLDRTRWPDTIDQSGWEYGVDLAYMRELVKHWRTRYDWREQE